MYQLEPLGWAGDALCREHPEISFFPETDALTNDAKAVCRECPVIDDCLTYALADDSLVGVWGGTTERERSNYRETRPRSRDPALASTTARARRVARHKATAQGRPLG
jgi:hypothetical protein